MDHKNPATVQYPSTQTHASAPYAISRREFLLGTGAALCALLFDVSAGSSSAGPSVRVGVILSGDADDAAELDSLMAGFELLVKEQNAGILQLTKKKAGAKDEKTLEALVRLLTHEDLHFLIAPNSLAGTEKCIHGLPEEKAILFVTHPSVKLVAGEMCAPGVFRLTPNTYQSAHPLAPWALSTLGGNAFLAGLNDERGNEEADFFAYGFERAGGTFVNRMMAPFESKAIADVVKKIAEVKPDVVFASFRGGAAAMFIKQYSELMGSEAPPLVGPESLAAYPQPAQDLGKMCHGIKTQGFLKDPVEFASRVKKRLGLKITSAERAAEGYDIAQVILKAWEKQGESEKGRIPGLTKIVEELQIEGPRGKIRFDKNHDPILETHVAQWEWSGKGLQRTGFRDLGVSRSADFGCGKVGFPSKPGQEEEGDED
ncbi:MAG: ABC transporter substrate-binding protein [Thermodesulfobacteriota bacterium]